MSGKREPVSLESFAFLSDNVRTFNKSALCSYADYHCKLVSTPVPRPLFLVLVATVREEFFCLRFSKQFGDLMTGIGGIEAQWLGCLS